MSRKPRKDYNSHFFHVICQGYEKQFVFKEDFFKKKYLNLMKKYSLMYNVKVLSYCIMDNHVHLLLYCDLIEDMSKFMQTVNSYFATYYNEKQNRVGYVFRDRFLSEPIVNQNYLYSCISYIHYNPVVAYIDFKTKTNFVNDEIILLLFDSIESYMDIFDFIHSAEGFGIDIKIDKPKLSYEKSKSMIEKILHNFAFCDLKASPKNIKAFFFKLFLREGITIYAMEKYFKIDHRTIKGIIKYY